MYCKECGTENQDDSFKCKSCGIFLRLLDTPLSGGDRIKIVGLFIMLAATIFFGVIPILIMLSALYIMKKDKSFTPIINAKEYIKTYLIFLALSTVALTTFAYYDDYSRSSHRFDMQQQSYVDKIQKETAMVGVGGLILAPIAVALFTFIFNSLFFKPLEEHRDWVTKNGVFTDEKEKNNNSTAIIGRDKLSAFSVADEMLKWNNLLEKGLITKEEFEKAKVKLMNEEKV